MERLDLDQIGDVAGLAPSEEAQAGAAIGGAGVVVLIRAEEVRVTSRSLIASVGDELRNDDRPAERLRSRGR